MNPLDRLIYELDPKGGAESFTVTKKQLVELSKAQYERGYEDGEYDTSYDHNRSCECC